MYYKLETLILLILFVQQLERNFPWLGLSTSLLRSCLRFFQQEMVDMEVQISLNILFQQTFCLSSHDRRHTSHVPNTSHQRNISHTTWQGISPIPTEPYSHPFFPPSQNLPSQSSSHNLDKILWGLSPLYVDRQFPPPNEAQTMTHQSHRKDARCGSAISLRFSPDNTGTCFCMLDKRVG